MPHRESARARAGWTLLGLVAAALVVLVLPIREIGMGREQLRGLIGSYLYEQTTYVDCPVSNLRCSDIYLPKTLRIDWDYTPLGTAAVYEVQRSADSGASWASIYTGSNRYLADSFDFSFGTQYQYRVRVTQDSSGTSLGLPAPPAGAASGDIHQVYAASGMPWTTISVTPMQAAATDNQAVDSRIDPRYSTVHYLDFQFGSYTYRGGLFAGYAADPAKVGRSFLKFSLPALPAGSNLWAASVNAYYTRSVTTGTTRLTCQSVATGWTASNLTWSLQPAFSAGAGRSFSVTYDGTDASAQWCHWSASGDVAAALSAGGLYAAGLGSGDETSANWAYLAKKEYDGTRPPQVLLACQAPFGVVDVLVSPDTIKGGSSANGTVYLNGAAPAGGAAVSLGASDPSVALPATVTIPAGALSATFPVTTTSVTGATSVTVSATYNGTGHSTPVTVTP